MRMGSQQQMSDLVRGDVSQDGVEAHRESFLQVFHRFNEDVAVGALAILRKVGDAKGFRNESPRLFFDTKHQLRWVGRLAAWFAYSRRDVLAGAILPFRLDSRAAKHRGGLLLGASYGSGLQSGVVIDRNLYR